MKLKHTGKITISTILLLVFSLNYAFAQIEEIEPNNKFSQVTQSIVVGDEIFGTLYSSDVDFYEFVLDDAGYIKFENVDQYIKFQFEIYDYDGQTLYKNVIKRYTSNIVEFPFFKAGKYYIALRSIYSSGGYKFKILHSNKTLPTDTFEPNNEWSDAKTVKIGVQNEAFLSAMERDFYHVNVRSTGLLDIIITFSNGIYPKISMYNKSGKLIASKTYLDELNTKVHFYYGITSPGDYYFLLEPIYDYNTNLFSPYSFIIRNKHNVIEEIEPNNRIKEVKQTFELGSSVIGSLTVNSEFDYFALEIDTPKLVHFNWNIYTAIQEPGMYFRIFRADGKKIYTSDIENSSTNFELDFPFYVPGKYYILLSENLSADNLNYQLKITKSKNNFPEDKYEPNNAIKNASSVSINEEINAAWDDPNGDEDFYAIEIDTMGILTLNYTYDACCRTSTGKILLYNSSGVLVDSNIYYPSVPKGIFFISKPGKYFFKPLLFNHEVNLITYKIESEFTPYNHFESEPNNKIFDADTLNFGDSLLGKISAQRDLDFHQFNATQVGKLAAKFEPANSRYYPYSYTVDLYNSKGKSLKNWKGEGVINFEYLLPEPGQYYFGVRMNRSVYNWKMDYKLSCSLDTSYSYLEPNNTIRKATAIALGDTVREQIKNRKDVDVYKFYIPQGGKLEANVLLKLGTWSNYFLTLYKSNGKVLRSNHFNYRRALSLTEFLDSGIYYVGIEGEGGAYYDFSLNLDTNHTSLEPNNTPKAATEIAFDSTVLDKINKPGDVDYFKFRVNKEGVIKLTATSNNNSFLDISPNMELLKKNGTVLVQNTGSNNSKSLTVTDILVDTGYYYLKFSDSRKKSQTGFYYLNAKLDTTASFREPNNDFSEASLIKLKDTVPEKIQSIGDRDFFKVHIPQSGKLTLEVYGMNYPKIQFNVNLFDENKEVVGYESNNLMARKLDFVEFVDAGIYYIEIFDNGNDEKQVGSYFLTADLDTTRANLEPNNSLSQAVEIVLNDTVEGKISLPGDEDYYKINLLNDGKVTIRLEAPSGGFIPKIELFDSLGNLFAFGPDQTEYGHFKLTDFAGPGSLVIKITNSLEQGKQSGIYQLKVELDTTISNPEPNDTFPQATLLNIGDTIVGRFSKVGDVDIYKIKNNKASGIKASLFGFKQNNLIPTIELLDDSGNVVDINYASSYIWTKRFNLESIVDSGYCYFKLFNKGNKNQEGFYGFRVVVSDKNVEVESNDTLSLANEINIGETLFGRISKNKDADYYKVYIPSSGRIFGKLKKYRAHQKFDPKIEIFKENGDYLALDYGKNFSGRDFQLVDHVDSGYYYFKVSDYEGGKIQVGYYSFQINHTPGIRFFSEPNDSFSIANEIDLNVINKYGRISKIGDMDVFKVYFPNRGKINTTLNLGKYGSFDPKIELFNKNEELLSVNSSLDFTGKSFQFVDIVDSGYHYLRVSDYWNDKVQQEDYYELTLSQESGLPVLEPNDSKDYAVLLALNDTVEERISKPNDVDYYKIALSKEDLFFANIFGAGNKNTLVLLDSLENVLDQTHSVLSKKIDKTGVYYLKVTNNDDRPIQHLTYKLTTFLDVLEPNNLFENATPLDLNNFVNGICSDVNDLEYFKFTIPSNGRIWIDIINNSRNQFHTGKFNVVLYDSSMNKLRSRKYDLDKRLLNFGSIQEKGGDFYFLIYPDNYDGHFNFSIKVTHILNNILNPRGPISANLGQFQPIEILKTSSKEISIAIQEKTFTQISIYNSTGQLVKNLFEGIPEIGSFSIDLPNHIPRGIYLLKVQTKKTVTILKVIKN